MKLAPAAITEDAESVSRTVPAPTKTFSSKRCTRFEITVRASGTSRGISTASMWAEWSASAMARTSRADARRRTGRTPMARICARTSDFSMNH